MGGMFMKTFKIILAATLTAIPSLAAVELPFSKQGFAQVEATLDFCAGLNPSTAQGFRDYDKNLTKGLSAKELEQARKSEEYQKTYKSITTELGKASKDQAVKACADFLKDMKK
jgi:hypothetical protein